MGLVLFFTQASVLEVKINIPHRLHNSIIGPRGKLIRSVMEECGGVRIRFPASDSTSDEINIHGPKEDVERARSMLMEMRDKQVTFPTILFVCL